MIKLLVVFAFSFTFLMAGCATVPDVLKHPQQGRDLGVLSPAKARIVVIREMMLKGAVGYWSISLDGRELSRLVVGSYVVKDVDPGEHWLARIDWPGVPAPLDVGPGKTYYLSYDLAILSGTEFVSLPEESALNLIEKYTRVKSMF
jgi:hypothetical protein